MGKDVSIIIVNYNTKELIKECVKSITKLIAKISYEIIVVDNASENIEELQSDLVKVLQLDENVGFGRANNAGANLSEGGVLFFLNPDTILLNNAIELLYDALMSTPDCGVCGANLYDANNEPTHSYNFCTMTLRHALRCFVKSNSTLRHISNQHNFFNKFKSVDYITGADLMITKQLFNEIGGFNEKIFMYYEDVDLCFKVRRKHKKCYSIPQAKIQHLEGQSFNLTSNRLEAINCRKRQMVGDSIAVFLRCNYKRLHRNAIISLNILILRLKLCFSKILNKDNSGIRGQLRFFKYVRKQV